VRGGSGPSKGRPGKASFGLAPGGRRTYVSVRLLTNAWREGNAMNLLWGLVVVLVVLWLLGFTMHVGGGLIHLLLVIAVIVVIVRLVSGRGV